MKRLLSATIALVATIAFGGSVSGVAAADDDHTLLTKWQRRLYSQVVPFDPQEPRGIGPGQQGRHETDCGPFGEAGRGPVDKDISCDDPLAPDNELAIAVHPENPNLVLAGSNDYQLNFVGATLNVQIPSGFFLSQDGGGTWIDGELPMKGDLGGGDPVPDFDVKHDQMVFASLSFVCGQGAPLCSRGNVMFASSPLSNLSGSSSDEIVWSDQTVANGNSSDAAAQQIFLDKEWMAVDNYRTLPNGDPNPNFGNIYITFTAFRIEKGRYDESPIWFVKSEDGGQRWTNPVEISGRNPRFCTFQDDPEDQFNKPRPHSTQSTAEGPDDPFACDQDQFSIPVVAPDGTLYVHFHNEQNSSAYELPQRYDSQVMLVRSTDGGDTFIGEQPTPQNQAGCVRPANAAFGPNSTCVVPLHVVNLEDSYDSTTHGTETPFPDYPLNVDGRTTLTGHQMRVNSAGNLAIGPNSESPLGYRLWVVFADNIDGVRPGPGQTQEGSPTFVPVSNTNVFYAYSDDGGLTWTGGDDGANSNPSTRLAVHERDAGPIGADQWFPWSAVDPRNGTLHVGYMDASVDGAVRRLYGFSNATITIAEADAGAFDPVPILVSSAPSDPDRSVFFRRQCPEPGEPATCASFIGDYNGLAVDSNGQVHSAWTDMRRAVGAVGTPPVAVNAQDAFYARQPLPPAP